MWGFIFLTIVHGVVFLIFLFEVVERIIKLHSFHIGLFNYVSTFTALAFTLSALLAYYKIITLLPVPYLFITLIPMLIYFVQIIILTIQRQRV